MNASAEQLKPQPQQITAKPLDNGATLHVVLDENGKPAVNMCNWHFDCKGQPNMGMHDLMLAAFRWIAENAMNDAGSGGHFLAADGAAEG